MILILIVILIDKCGEDSHTRHKKHKFPNSSSFMTQCLMVNPYKDSHILKANSMEVVQRLCERINEK